MKFKLHIPRLPEVPEAAYRSRYLREDFNRAAVGISIVALTVLPFVSRDYQFLGSSWQFYGLLAGRALLVFLSVILIAYMRKVRNYHTYDRLLSAWMVIAVTLNLLINATRPADYYVYITLDVVYLSLIYIIFPNKLKHQIMIMLSYSVADILILFFTKDKSLEPVFFIAVTAFILSNGLGIIAHWLFDYYRREGYLSIERAENALAEVKTLRGFLPICSSCKKIRNDKGYWQAVEQYITEHSEAEFTHGLCPDCLKKLSGEEMLSPPDEIP
jgi:hypothetical protein